MRGLHLVKYRVNSGIFVLHTREWDGYDRPEYTKICLLNQNDALLFSSCGFFSMPSECAYDNDHVFEDCLHRINFVNNAVEILIGSVFNDAHILQEPMKIYIEYEVLNDQLAKKLKGYARNE